MTSNLFKVIHTYWFTSGGLLVDSFGLVIIDTGRGWKAYIGHCMGENEEFDAQRIAAHGAKFPRDAAIAIFPDLKAEEFQS